jgi:hypothetical protein
MALTFFANSFGFYFQVKEYNNATDASHLQKPQEQI